MNKPNNYENTTAAGDFTPIELGGHILEIKKVEETTSKNGRPMLKIFFDTAKSDSQPGYFAKQFRDDIRPEKKWPFGGTTYMLTEDESGNCTRNFKGFITSVEKSNAGFSVVWGDGFAKCFTGKQIGGVFGIVHDYYNGKNINKRQLRWFRSVEGIQEVEIPEETETNAYKFQNGSAPAPGSDGFMNIPDGIDEELPFN